MIEDIKIIHLKSNAQQLETWIALLKAKLAHMLKKQYKNLDLKQ